MEFNRKEALRYLRARPNDKEAQALVDMVYLKLRGAGSACAAQKQSAGG